MVFGLAAAAYALIALLTAVVLTERVAGYDVKFADALLGLILGVLWPVSVPVCLGCCAVAGLASLMRGI